MTSGSIKPDSMTSKRHSYDRVLIACAMMEDEVRCALNACEMALPITWIDRGYHSKPDVLRSKLQKSIDAAEKNGAREVLLAIGLCGLGAVGLQTRRAVLAMPRFDDCVNMMLCTGMRERRGYAQAGVLYLTRGWAHDASIITGQYELYRRKYGEKHADRLMEAMYEPYKAVSLIDNGCYETAEVQPYAQQCADLLKVNVQTVKGSNTVLQKLISGKWDKDILVCRPQQPVMQEDFNFQPAKDEESSL